MASSVAGDSWTPAASALSSPGRFITSALSKPIVLVVEDTDEWCDAALQAKLFLTSLVLPSLPPIIQQRINRSMLVQRSSGASVPTANITAVRDDLPIGILPVPVGSAGANSLVVHGAARCSLNDLAAAHQSQELMSWIAERSLVQPVSTDEPDADGHSGGVGGVGGGGVGGGHAPSQGNNTMDLHVVAQPDVHEIGDAAAFRANASMVEVVVVHRSADGLVLRSVTMEVLNNLTGLQFKSKVIAALELEGGFQHFLMSLDGQAFGSRVPLFAHTSFRAGCVIEIEDIGDRPKASGHT